MKPRFFITLVICTLQNIICIAKPVDGDFDNGLSFYSHAVNQDQRTAMDLTAGQPFRFPREGFQMQFDLKLKEELYTYGYVVRIVADNAATSFDIIAYLLKGKLNFVLTGKNANSENIAIEDADRVMKNQWIGVKLQFHRDDIVIEVDDTILRMAHSFRDFKRVEICFGRNRHPDFYTTDVPPMTIRNVTIRNHHGKILNQWPLTDQQHEVADRIKGRKALVENGIWEVDKYRKWTKVNSITVHEKNPQTCYDSSTGCVFIVSDKMLFVYDARNDKTDTIFVQHGSHYGGVGSQVVYNPVDERLISYNPDVQKICVFDFKSRSWSDSDRNTIVTSQHHNRAVDRQSGRLILFGGYGNHRYNAQLSTISLDEPQTWDTVSLDSIIYPRYLSAMGWQDERHLLMMGGHGSPSGKQEESPRNFYDLYRLDVRDGTVAKVWELDRPASHFVFGNTLVADTASNSIYSLMYDNSRFNTEICLSRFDLQTKVPAYRIVSDSIRYDFLDIRSFCDLFADRQSASLYAIVQQVKDSESTTVDIYRLQFPPPLPGEITWADTHTDRTPHSGRWSEYMILAFIVSATVFAFARTVYAKKKRKDYHAHTVAQAAENKSLQTQASPGARPDTGIEISLLGGFQIFDRAGNDITGEFTPTLKQLFLCLLLRFIKYGKGMTSQSLDETFWFELERSKAANNRNVNIRKLRLILHKTDGVHIAKKGSYWFAGLGDDVVCDYKEVIEGLSRIKSSADPILKHNITRIIRFATSGSLLPNIDAEWLDEYKAEYSSLIAEIMLQAMEHPEIREDNRMMLRIADVVLISDPIDEDAVRIKCKILYRTGQKGLSKQCYDKFCIEYRRLLNTSPELKYEHIIS